MAEKNGSASIKIKNGNFICGVVEGFYGRPWTTEQRKDLFRKLKKWGMDSYLYAPKDDYKHRAYWRDLYTVEEAEHLTGLISAAKESGITFFYALSPGLDITYSSVKEVTALKRKLEQVNQFGCQAFALLFDDIEPEMSEADKEVFQSFAHAQVSVTNDIFQHLGQPRFLLCPTQYCATRALPNVGTSEYLNTLGSKLAQEIDVMWTGPKVISRILTVESIEEITEILKRPPVIWDNLHANDYDQKRVFLGPYSGRSPDLIPKLRGVLTNPNCEYGANFVAIHTLAQWSKCNIDGQRDLSMSDTVSSDIKLETELEDGVIGEDVPSTLCPNMYHPRQALKNAIDEWISEFNKKRTAFGVIAKPQPAVAPTIPIPIIPSVNTCMSLTTSTTTTTVTTTTSVSSIPVSTIPSSATINSHSSHLQALAEVCSTVINSTDGYFTPSPVGPVMNSLISETKVVSEPVLLPSLVASAVEAVTSSVISSSSEPMDCNSTPALSPAHQLKTSGQCDESMVENIFTCTENSGGMQIELDHRITTVNGTHMMVENEIDLIDNNLPNLREKVCEPEEHGQCKKIHDKKLTYEDIALLCDLFYLPFEHGSQGIQLLQDFNWLKSNACVLITKPKEEIGSCKSYAEEWHTRATKMNDMAEAVNRLLHKIMFCNNRELLYDLYSYVWDMRGVVSLLNSYVKWLGFSNGWKETFMSGDQEPWVFRGGLTADLQRLIPVDSANDLFLYKPPEVPSNKLFTIRPYKNTDEKAIYAICNKIYNCNTVFSAVADRFVGDLLTLSPEFCMVVEDQTGIMGYALTALNIKTYNEKLSVSWIPEMKTKYPIHSITSDMLPIEKEAIQYFHNFVPDVPEQLSRLHPSKVSCLLLPIMSDYSVSKRLITCVLAALRTNGSFGVHTELSISDKDSRDFYTRLGFIDLNLPFDDNLSTITMGRSF